NTCNGEETCQACVGCEIHLLSCCGRQSTCLPGTAARDDTPCDDRNQCTVNDHCAGGRCSSGGTRSCDDGDPCTDDSCSSTAGCEHTLRTFCRLCRDGCDDRNPCNGDETCAGLYCAPGVPPDCVDTDPCTQDRCDPASGCVHEALPTEACGGVRLPNSLRRHFK